MEAMEQEGKQQLPVLPRLDRLDRLLQLLEERHSMSGRQLRDHVVREKGHEKEEEEEEDQRKSLSSALDEVYHKGTLMDRVATLENRVLQLSMEMDEGNTSRSSSSTVQVSKNVGRDLNTSAKVSRQDKHEVEIAIQHVQKEKEGYPPLIQEETIINQEVTTQSTGDGSGKRAKKKGGYMKKWIRWFRCGQERHWNDDFGWGPNTMELRSK